MTRLSNIYTGISNTNGVTNLSYNPSTRTVQSDTGTGAVITEADNMFSGLMTSAEKAKLTGIESNAQANVPTNLAISNTTINTLDITSSTGTDITLPSAVAGVSAGLLTGNDKTKVNICIVSDTTQSISGSSVQNIVSITQAAYNSLGTPNANTLYIIVG